MAQAVCAKTQKVLVIDGHRQYAERIREALRDIASRAEGQESIEVLCAMNYEDAMRLFAKNVESLVAVFCGDEKSCGQLLRARGDHLLNEASRSIQERFQGLMYSVSTNPTWREEHRQWGLIPTQSCQPQDVAMVIWKLAQQKGEE